MREILFRGKQFDNGEWIEGSLLIDGEKHRPIDKPQSDFSNTYIIPETERDNTHCKFIDGGFYLYTTGFHVDPSTVGQYTGLTDKNGVKIFEGDIVTAQDDIWGSPFCNGITGKIIYDEAAFFIMPKDRMETQWLYNECAVYEVIGNIHDNPELIGGNDNA